MIFLLIHKTYIVAIFYVLTLFNNGWCCKNMTNEILLDDVYEFNEQYKKDENNIVAEKKIRKLGIMKASIDEDRKSMLKFEFNVEVPETKIYNQYGSHQCNTYAFLRVVKDILRKNTHLNVDELDLSSNYINFFDKLEKANVLYNELIACSNLSLEIINCKVNQFIGSFGTFHYCREIVNKYGLVPTKDMNELSSNYNDALAIELLRDKIKCDAICLLDKKTKKEKQSRKKELMYEVYQFLSKVYGTPPTNFVFQGKQMTPFQFKEHYLNDSLDEYVTVTSFPKETLFSSYSFIPNVYLNDQEKIIKLPIGQIKESIIKQLSEGVSVWFSAEESTTLDYEDNILDDKLYNLNELLNIKNIAKNKKMLLDLINYDHAMCITGALVEKNDVKQFKVDNSFGKHGVFKGKLIMTVPFFENYVITTIINKKYIS